MTIQDSQDIQAGKLLASKARVDSLDGLRGLAALSVVLLHLFSTLRDTNIPGMAVVDSFFKIADKTPFNVFWAGNQAVYLFFIMSGFALTSMLDNFKYGYPAYCVRRIMRLWAPCIISIFAALLIIGINNPTPNALYGAWYNNLIPKNIGWLDIVNHFFMIGEFDSTKINFVTWSLVHELRLSFVFPVLLLLVRRKPMFAVCTISLLVSVIALVLRSKGYVSENKTSLMSTLIYQIFFVIGIYIHDRRDILIEKCTKISSVARSLFLLVGIVIYSNLLGSLYFSGLAGGTIIVICAVTPGFFAKLLKIAPIHWLGQVSYSLYLIHPLIIINMFNRLQTSIEMIGMVFILVPPTLLAAALYHRAVEMPLNHAGQKLSRWIGAGR